MQSLKKHNYNGIIVLSVGTGKSKVAIDAIKEGKFKNILITSPRTNLKENWWNELNKWYFNSIDFAFDKNNFKLRNIQTCYKWSVEELKQFDLIIIDEIHTIS